MSWNGRYLGLFVLLAEFERLGNRVAGDGVMKAVTYRDALVAEQESALGRCIIVAHYRRIAMAFYQ